MNHPPFTSLPAVAGFPDLRFINGQIMDVEQYDTEGWQVIGAYQTDDGKPGHYWAVDIAGLHRYSDLRNGRREERRLSWQDRNSEDESLRELIDADDAKARYGR